MNSTPVVLHNISGTSVIADVRVPKGTRRVSVIPVDPQILANCALLSAEEYELLTLEDKLERESEEEASSPRPATDPFERIEAVIQHINVDAISYEEFVREIDRVGLGHSIDALTMRRWYTNALATL